jgi:hypothetical protein
VPYEQASKYDSTDIPILVDMLSDTSKKIYWSNIVITLGMIGDESAVDTLIGFINKSENTNISKSHYLAKSGVLFALGFIINKTNNSTAINFLRNRLQTSNWDSTSITWKAPYHNSFKQRDFQLLQKTILGLAITGSPQIVSTLDSVKTDTTFNYYAEIKDLVIDAININQRIDSLGLSAYFKGN